MKKIIVGAIAVALLTGIGYVTIDTISAPKAQSDCVTVVVDYQSLGSEKTTECVPVSGKTSAIDIFNNAGFKFEGTQKYPIEIICRVNGLPSATKAIVSAKQKGYLETCSDMPADFAYWALLIKTPKKDWDWSPVGVADLTLSPGESVALVFSVDDKLVLPN